MNRTRNYLFPLMVFLFSMVACNKPAGEGGTSRVKGTVYVRDYNGNYTILESVHPGMEERVYIIYGDHDFYDDDVRASYDGVYAFENLRKGTYTVFAYTEDSTSSPLGELYPIIHTVEITEEYQTVEVPIMFLLR